MSKFRKLRNLLRFSLLKSAYFNFHYLPFRQAIHLPVLLRKPRFPRLKGSVKILLDDNQKLKPGLIQLGAFTCSLFPDSGITFENHGGTVIFRGAAYIGNSSAISVGERGRLDIGADFGSSALRLVCYHSITFDAWVRIGWNSLVMDSDMHTMVRISDGGHTRGYAPVRLGRGCWIGTDTLLMKGTELPARVTVAAGSKLAGDYDVPSDSIIGSDSRIVVLKEGLYRDKEHDNDHIAYPDMADGAR